MHLIQRFSSLFGKEEGAPVEMTAKKPPAPIKGIVVDSEKDRHVIASGSAYTPEQLIGYIRQAETGDIRFLMAFFDEMRATDPHLDCELSKAEDYLVGSRIDILPYPPTVRGPSNKGKAEANIATEVAAYVESQIFAPSVRLDRAIAALADGLWKGVGGFEVLVDKKKGPDGKERLREFVQIPSQRFRYIPATTTLALQCGEEQDVLTPVTSLAPKIVYLVADGEVPSPARRGLMRKCMGPWLIRRHSPQFWARFVELFGSPLRVGKFNPGDENMRAALVAALKSMGSAAWAALPDGAAIDLVETNARSTGNPPHELLLSWAAREMSKVILGATQSTDVQRSTGSKNSAQVHHDVTIARSGSRAVIIAAVLREQLIAPLVARNFGQDVADLYTPEIKIRVENKPDIYNASQAMKMLQDAGMTTIPVAYVHDWLSIPIPDPEELCLELPLLPGVVAPGSKPGDAPVAPSKKGAETPSEDEEDDAPEDSPADEQEDTKKPIGKAGAR